MNKCFICGGEAFRFCPTCKFHRCGEHICEHLEKIDAELKGTEIIEEEYDDTEEDDIDRPIGNWLSNDVIISGIPTAKLREYLAVLESQIITVKMELARREAPLKRRASTPIPFETRQATERIARPAKQVLKTLDALRKSGLEPAEIVRMMNETLAKHKPDR